MPLGTLSTSYASRCAGQDRVATAWLAVVMWLYMALGETRLLSQPRMTMVAWAALFGLPPAYVRFRALAHAAADEATAAFGRLVAAGALDFLQLVELSGDTYSGPCA